ncbi:hypothetical protein FRC07_007288 [Ceratobasidium sp. 392]|nr:hypothetical protein FRC07_007288 [Ceratobasidium sp. 392]
MTQDRRRLQIAANTPIERVPDYLISEIFVLVCNYWEAISSWRKSRTHLPSTLASVSRRWRAIALSTSRIWNFIDISLHAEHVVTRLARNRGLPIDVALHLVEHDHPNTEALRKSLHILERGENWTRIRNLDLTVVQNSDDKQVSAVGTLVLDTLNNATDANFSNNIENITVLVLEQNFHWIACNDEELFLCLPHSPNLHSVRLDKVGLALMQPGHESPLPRLQRLELTRVSIGLSDLFVPLLNLAPNLEMLSLDTCWFWQEPSLPTVPDRSILMVGLKRVTLYIVERGAIELSIALQALNMPNLQSLVITSTVVPDHCNLGFPIDWRFISYCHALEFLGLHCFGCSNFEGFLPHLHKLGNLKELELSAHELTDDPQEFIEQLTQTLTDAMCCPMLNDLCINFDVDAETVQVLEGLERIRPHLHVDVDSDPLDYEYREDGTYGWDTDSDDDEDYVTESD